MYILRSGILTGRFYTAAGQACREDGGVASALRKLIPIQELLYIIYLMRRYGRAHQPPALLA